MPPKGSRSLYSDSDQPGHRKPSLYQSWAGTQDHGASIFAPASKVLLGYFLWFDVLAATCSDNGPLLPVDHDSLLECAAVDIGQITGCENWVLKCLRNITALSRWRSEAVSLGTLSIFELGRRATAIQEELRESLLVSQQKVTSLQGGQRTAATSYRGYLGEDVGGMITPAFGHAAIAYLHVVISGPNPRLGEIQHAISHARHYLEMLADSGFLGYAA